MIMEADVTEAEKHFDALIAERRAKGRATYGTGLDHTADYNWQQMALEEALDLAQYLSAENLRLRERVASLADELDSIAWAANTDGD